VGKWIVLEVSMFSLGAGGTVLHPGLMQPVAFSFVIIKIQAAMPAVMAMRDKGGNHAGLGVVLRGCDGRREAIVSRIASLIVDIQEACANRPVIAQAQADPAHRLLQLAAGVGLMAIRLSIAPRQAWSPLLPVGLSDPPAR